LVNHLAQDVHDDRDVLVLVVVRRGFLGRRYRPE
jgi:hypothetical protein